LDPKRVAGEKAAELVEDGMVVGLGTGSTVRYTILKVGELVSQGLGILAIPTSKATESLAKELQIPLTTLEEHPKVDLTIDGADEVDPNLNLVKGLGGALVREKIVASASRRFAIVVDESKLVELLGTRSPVPVEVLPFGWKVCESKLSELGAEPKLRVEETSPFVTDNGNYILDCRFPGIADPHDLERAINRIPGVVENGLFLKMADEVFVGGSEGVRRLTRALFD